MFNWDSSSLICLHPAGNCWKAPFGPFCRCDTAEGDPALVSPTYPESRNTRWSSWWPNVCKNKRRACRISRCRWALLCCWSGMSVIARLRKKYICTQLPVLRVTTHRDYGVQCERIWLSARKEKTEQTHRLLELICTSCQTRTARAHLKWKNPVFSAFSRQVCSNKFHDNFLNKLSDKFQKRATFQLIAKKAHPPLVVLTVIMHSKAVLHTRIRNPTLVQNCRRTDFCLWVHMNVISASHLENGVRK